MYPAGVCLLTDQRKNKKCCNKDHYDLNMRYSTNMVDVPSYLIKMNIEKFKDFYDIRNCLWMTIHCVGVY